MKKLSFFSLHPSRVTLHVLSCLLIFNIGCSDDSGPVNTTPPVKAYVPTSVPEFSVAETILKAGTIITSEGRETLAVIFPVVGVKVVDGKIRLNQDVTLENAGNQVDAQANIYGAKGLTIDVIKSSSNPNPHLTFAGVELVTELIPPPNLSGTLVVNIVVKDLNAEGKTVKITRGFRSNKAINPNEKCSMPETQPTQDTNPAPVKPGTQPAPPKLIPVTCTSRIIKTYGSGNVVPYLSGVDNAAVAKEPEPKLIGKWDIQKPVFNWFNETKPDEPVDANGDPIETKQLPPGIITIEPNKYFIWQKDDDITQGPMQQVIPRSYADPNITYWKIYSGKSNYYIFLKNGQVYLNDLDSHLLSLVGKPLK